MVSVLFLLWLKLQEPYWRQEASMGNSDVPGPAWPESWGLGLSQGSSGL